RVILLLMKCCFFSSRRRHTRCLSDWSSDVCSSDLAMVVAARKFYKTEEDLRGKFNPETGQVDVYSVLTVVEEVNDPKKEITVAEAKKKNPSAEVGTEILTPKPTDVLGRIAAQTAKQVILQKVREAERDTMFNDYN